MKQELVILHIALVPGALIVFPAYKPVLNPPRQTQTSTMTMTMEAANIRTPIGTRTTETRSTQY